MYLLLMRRRAAAIYYAGSEKIFGLPESAAGLGR